MFEWSEIENDIYILTRDWACGSIFKLNYWSFSMIRPYIKCWCAIFTRSLAFVFLSGLFGHCVALFATRIN